MRFSKVLPTAFIALSAVFLTATISQAAVDTIRVNSGGAAYTDVAGHQWAADSGFSGGTEYNESQTFAGTSDQTLHQYERYGEFSYSFNVTPGSYKVNLYEATLYDGLCGEGTRVFSVTINGAPFLTDYDMSAEVGCLTAQIKTGYTTTTTGNITISFIANVSNPKVNAVEIVPGVPAAIFDKASRRDSKLSVSSSKNGISIQSQAEGAYKLELRTLRGERIGQKNGFGAGQQSFTNLRPGLYLLTSTVDHQTATRTISVVR